MVSQLLNLLRNIRYSDRPRAEAESAIQADEIKLWQDTSDLVTSYPYEIEALVVDLLKGLKFTRHQFKTHPLVEARFS